MNHLITESAKKAGISISSAKKFTKILFNSVMDEVTSGNVVKFTGFVKIFQSVRKSRNGINPKTLEKTIIPETKTIRFVAGETFKNKVRG